MNIEQIQQEHADRINDHLFNECDWLSVLDHMGQEAKEYFFYDYGGVEDIISKVAECTTYKPWDNYHMPSSREGVIHFSIPVGEVEVAPLELDSDVDPGDYTINGEYAYIPLLSVLFEFDADQFEELVEKEKVVTISDIHESMLNGQKRQAIDQAKEYENNRNNVHMDYFDYLEDTYHQNHKYKLTHFSNFVFAYNLFKRE